MIALELARFPDEPQFAVGLLKFVMELRRDRKVGLDGAMARALKGLRVDRHAFRAYVVKHQEKYLRSVEGVRAPALVRAR